MDNVIELSHITKRFGTLTALNDVDFDLREGETHALVGALRDEPCGGEGDRVRMEQGPVSQVSLRERAHAGQRDDAIRP